MTLARISLAITGVLFVVLGLAFLADPGRMAEIVGIEADRGRASIEVRAMYGGFELALGIFFLVATSRTRWFRAALAAQALGFAGLAAGRFVGMTLDGPDRRMLGLAVIECGGAVLGLVAFRQARNALLAVR